MSGFFHLPFELREIILELALTTPYSPPLNPWTGAERRQPLPDINNYIGPFGTKSTLYDASLQDRLVTSRSLLLTNRQLHSDTKIVLQRFRPTYHLDVMAVHGWDLWATWLLVPAVRSHVDELTVTLRLFANRITTTETVSNLIREEQKGLKWCFFAILERFLIHGPTTELSAGEKKDLRFYANTLTLNIKSGVDDQDSLPLPDKSNSEHTPPGMKALSSGGQPHAYRFVPRPWWQARFLYGKLNALLRLYAPGWGGMLYEHFGRIRMMVEGRLVEEVDLAAMLASLQPQGAWHCKSFYEWRGDALRKREVAGLPVVWPEDAEYVGS